MKQVRVIEEYLVKVIVSLHIAVYFIMPVSHNVEIYE